jgi:hypothetical protein
MQILMRPRELGREGSRILGIFILTAPVDGNAGVNQKNGIVVADARLRTK